MHLETLTACPICECTMLSPVTNGRAAGAICGDCHTVFQNPRLDEASTREFYAGLYRDTVNVGNVNDQQDIDVQRARADFQLHACWDYIENARTMLEIGCSLGYLMDKLSVTFDIDCVGIEPDRRYHAVDPACNYRLYSDIHGMPIRKFDLVCMSHSLEHMREPLEYLSYLMDNYSHKDTRFMIEVPNYGLTPDTLNASHTFAFTEDTLNGMFARLGYKPLMMRKHYRNMAQLPVYLLGVYGRA